MKIGNLRSKTVEYFEQENKVASIKNKEYTIHTRLLNENVERHH